MDAVTVPKADRTIAISTIARRELQRYYPVDHDRITKIPHGVDTARFTPDVSDHPAVTPDKFTLLHVGRLVSRRHVDLVIQGVAAIDRNDIELLVAGTRRHRDRLEAQTRELGVANQVEFLGFVPEEELPSLYATSNAFAFLAQYEGFGLTFLEAMACGTSVIATPVGGVPDIVVDDESGLIVDHDVRSVEQAITELADNNSRVAEMGERARCIAEGRT